jgi:hypothetical protein
MDNEEWKKRKLEAETRGIGKFTNTQFPGKKPLPRFASKIRKNKFEDGKESISITVYIPKNYLSKVLG